jgi:hypothetical protein
MKAKHRFTQDLHGATSQKKAFFIVTAVKTSNFTSFQSLDLNDATGNKQEISGRT